MEVIVAKLEELFVYVRKHRNSQKNLAYYSLSSCRDLNPGPRKYDALAITIRVRSEVLMCTNWEGVEGREGELHDQNLRNKMAY
jgi:hypothetical protein